MSRHHPSCPPGAHVHPSSSRILLVDYIVWLDGMPLVATGERGLADRVAELINAHGLADVPDRIPDALLWAPPHPDGQLIDWRLPPNPTQENQP